MKYESWGKISVYNDEIKKKKKAFENQKNLQKKKPSQRPKSHTLLILPFSFHLHLHWRILRWSLIQTQFRHRSSSCLLELRLNIINKLHSQIKRYRMELCSRYTYYTGCILYIFHLLDTGMEMAINEDTMLVCPPPPPIFREIKSQGSLSALLSIVCPKKSIRVYTKLDGRRGVTAYPRAHFNPLILPY